MIIPILNGRLDVFMDLVVFKDKRSSITSISSGKRPLFPFPPMRVSICVVHGRPLKWRGFFLVVVTSSHGDKDTERGAEKRKRHLYII